MTMKKKELRQGYTTGACAAAASLGAAIMLKEQRIVTEVELPLPAGFSAVFPVQGQRFDAEEACCSVVKDAGDDPDITHGMEISALVSLKSRTSEEELPILLKAGEGVGTVTKKGLAVEVGQPAINPVPRRMILEAVGGVFPDLGSTQGLEVTIIIPEGEKRATKTLNARLGILGGLSVLGTSGVVKPISHKAWTDTLEVALDVSLATGRDTAVLSTGRTSEDKGRELVPDLPVECFVMMGDHVGYAMQACHRKGIKTVLLSAQFAKLVKIACGHPQTHVHSSRLDLSEVARWAETLGMSPDEVTMIEGANTAREVYVEFGAEHPLVADVAARALRQLGIWAPGMTIAILLVGYGEGPDLPFGDWTTISTD